MSNGVPDKRSLADAVLAYDTAIHSCANDPEKMASFCSAEGDDLDALYLDMVNAARNERDSAPSATLPPGVVELVQMIDKLEDEGNGWNPALHPGLTNEAEKEFRQEVVSNWRAIRKYIPVPRSDGGTAT